MARLNRSLQKKNKKKPAPSAARACQAPVPVAPAAPAASAASAASMSGQQGPGGDLGAIFRRIDALYAGRTEVKTHSQNEKDTVEIPFRLEQQGRSGDLRLRADPDADGARPCRQDVVRLHSMRAPDAALSAPASSAASAIDPRRWLAERVVGMEGLIPLEDLQCVWSPWARGAEKYGPESLITARSGSDSFMSKSVPPRALGVRYAEASSRLALSRGANGAVSGFREVDCSPTGQGVTGAPRRRRPGRKTDFSRGSTSNAPLRPGGLARRVRPADHGKEDLSRAEVAIRWSGLSESEGKSSSGAAPPSLCTHVPGFVGMKPKTAGMAAAEPKSAAEGATTDRSSSSAAATNGKMSWAGGRIGQNRINLIQNMLSMDDEDWEAAAALRERQARRRQLAERARAEGSTAMEKELRANRLDQKVRTRRALRRDGPSLLSEAMRLSASGTGVDAVWRRDLERQGLNGILDDDEQVEDVTSLSDVKTPATGVSIDTPTVASKQASRPGVATQLPSDARRTWAVMSRESVDDFHERVPDMAIRYPFELDRFQKEAVLHVERNRCVFVAAHTSAGKTVVAEYAVALACKHMTRAVYTSPIKTLSNQKFREFRKTFGERDVGIMTGDVSINTEATCLILTTEILRSMLYRGADLIRDIEWVIFDEVHYINDRERGVVWEEVIILLPDHVNIVMLSATVPNTFEFADWVGRTKRKPVYVVSTDRRPVPLQHYVWCHNRLFKVLDDQGQFRPQGLRQARAEGKKRERQSKASGRIVRKSGGGSSRGRWYSLVQYLQKLDLLPLAVFSFSKRVCEDLTYALGGLNLNANHEKGLVLGFVDRSVRRLPELDRRLPQVQRVRALAARGIGVHHAGMLPILKEIVEMLFSRGLVKVLFATETFAMGVNMPTRTVVFNGTRKHDGTQFRELLPGEYTQMSGRAGRRGLDSFGVVIQFCRADKVPDEASTRKLLLGRSTRLSSQFRLTYNMILNLLRQEDISVADFIKRSFGEVFAQRAAPAQRAALAAAEAKLRAIGAAPEGKQDTPAKPTPPAAGAAQASAATTRLCKAARCGSGSISAYFAVHARAATLLADEMRDIMSNPMLSERFLNPGRVVLLRLPSALPSTRFDRPAIGVILKRGAPSDADMGRFGGGGATGAAKFVLTALVLCPAAAKTEALKSRARADGMGGVVGGERYLVCSVRPENLYRLTRTGIDVSASAILLDRFPEAISTVVGALAAARDGRTGGLKQTVRSRRRRKGGVRGVASSSGSVSTGDTGAVGISASISADSTTASGLKCYPWLEALHPIRDMKQSELQFVERYRARCEAQDLMPTLACHSCPHRSAHLASAAQEEALRQRASQLRRLLSDDNVHLISDFEQRLCVLRSLDYIDAGRAVLLKGRVACEINTCDSLLATELIFENVILELEPPEAVALFSSLVFQRRVDTEPQLNGAMRVALGRLEAVALALGNVQAKEGLDVAPEQFARDAIHPGLMQVCYEWARGTAFVHICELTDVPEGTIVRCILRLYETLKDVRNAARVIGDPKLYQMMEKCAEMIKRDIVFAGSLYIS